MIQRMVREWEGRWKKGTAKGRFPEFINKMATDYVIEWNRIRKGYVSILVADSQGAH